MYLVSSFRVRLISVPAMSHYEIAKIPKPARRTVIFFWGLPAIYRESSFMASLIYFQVITNNQSKIIMDSLWKKSRNVVYEILRCWIMPGLQAERRECILKFGTLRNNSAINLKYWLFVGRRDSCRDTHNYHTSQLFSTVPEQALEKKNYSDDSFFWCRQFFLLTVLETGKYILSANKRRVILKIE